MAEEKAPVEQLLDAQNIDRVQATLLGWIDQYVLIAGNLIQLVLFVAGVVGAVFIDRRVTAHLERFKAAKPSRARTLAVDLVERLLIPVFLLVWIGVCMGGFILADEPYHILRTVASLTMAWAIIRLGSSVISNHAVSKAVAALVWIVAALNITGLLDTAIKHLDETRIGKGESALSLYDIVSSIVSVALFLWVALVLIRIVEARINASATMAPAAKVLFSKLFKFGLIAVAFLFGISAVGLDLTAFAVFGGAIGVGIGFGLQKIFSNLIAGIILLLDKSIKPGDTLVIGGSYGRVETLSARYVSVITRDAIEHLVPNEELIINRVENWSYSHDRVRLKIPLGVHYKSDVNSAIELCVEAANAVERVLESPAPVCLLKGFGDSSVDLEIRIWVNDPMNGCSNVKSQVLLGVWERFHEHDIEIPYPQRDLHLRSVAQEASVELSTLALADATG